MPVSIHGAHDPPADQQRSSSPNVATMVKKSSASRSRNNYRPETAEDLDASGDQLVVAVTDREALHPSL
ncbi:hypothetical protein ACQP2F_13695 [Actinoplanes sp. CA-030573]|uniref:hypothetical protein n=1 Tax=Actinoplanes sp. CA-030573 TaxID=3239898 RepID=UPI003D8E264C